MRSDQRRRTFLGQVRTTFERRQKRGEYLTTFFDREGEKRSGERARESCGRCIPFLFASIGEEEDEAPSPQKLISISEANEQTIGGVDETLLRRPENLDQSINVRNIAFSPDLAIDGNGGRVHHAAIDDLHLFFDFLDGRIEVATEFIECLLDVLFRFLTPGAARADDFDFHG